MTRLVAAAGALMGVLLGLPLIAAAGTSGGAVPTTMAVADIPQAYLAIYQDAVAKRCPTLPWAVLAAIGKIESNHGRSGGGRLGSDGRVAPPLIGIPLDGSAGTQRILDTDDGMFDGDTVYDRAVGPMQFIPTTWATSGVDASGDGLANPHNAIDAIHAAAAYLCAVGADDPNGVRDAVWAYNHPWDYVDAVLTQAARYAEAGIDQMPSSPTLVAMVLTNPRLTIYEGGRQDIAEGIIDARVLAVLQLASESHTIHISSLKAGHSRCVGGADYDGCKVSHHWHGRGVDITMVDGHRVTVNNAAARSLAVVLGELPAPLRPDEVGTPWSDLVLAGFFSDQAHADHLHVGFRLKG